MNAFAASNLEYVFRGQGQFTMKISGQNRPQNSFLMIYEPRGRGFDSCQPHQTSQRVSFRSHKDQGASPFGFVIPQVVAQSA